MTEPTPRFVSSDKRTGITVAVIFIVVLLIMPILLIVGKRSDRANDYSTASALHNGKYD